MKHKHHIIPRHAGGTDDPENIIELTLEEHAEAHRKLYEKHGRWQDKCAYLALSGQIGKEEIIYEVQVNALKEHRESADWSAIALKAWKTRRKNKKTKTWNKNLKKGNAGKYEKSFDKLSQSLKKARAEGKLANIGDIMRGKELSEEHKQKLSEIAKKREKVKCPLCGVSAIKQVLSMWHGKGKCDVAPDLDSDKTCRDCGEVKKLRDYPIQGRKQNGHPKHKNWCKVCENKRRRDRRRKS